MQRIRVRRGQRQTQAIGNPACWPAALHRPSRVTAKATNKVLKRRLTLRKLSCLLPTNKNEKSSMGKAPASALRRWPADKRPTQIRYNRVVTPATLQARAITSVS